MPHDFDIFPSKMNFEKYVSFIVELADCLFIVVCVSLSKMLVLIEANSNLIKLFNQVYLFEKCMFLIPPPHKIFAALMYKVVTC